MNLREVVPVVTALIAAITAVFVTMLVFAAHLVTSPQWRYLFSVPGGQWSWAALFGAATLLMAVGLALHRHRVTAIGYGLLTFGSALISAFYLAAPLIDPGLVTFDWYPWAIALIPGLVGTVLYLKPASWS